MKNIRGKDTRIEVILRKALWNKGYRYRKNYKKLPRQELQVVRAVIMEK